MFSVGLLSAAVELSFNIIPVVLILPVKQQQLAYAECSHWELSSNREMYMFSGIDF